MSEEVSVTPIAALAVASITLKDVDGAELPDLDGAGFVRAETVVSNQTAEWQAAIVTFRLLDGEGEAISMVAVNKQLEANVGEKVSGGFRLPASISGLTVEVTVQRQESEES